MPESTLVRQSIYDNHMRVKFYELFYRQLINNKSIFPTRDSIDGDLATHAVIQQAGHELGLEAAADGHPAFINFTRNTLLSPDFLDLPQDKVVIEVLEDNHCDKALVDALTGYSKTGFKISLDDFVYNESLRPLLEIADFVKVDVLDFEENDLLEQVRLLKPYKVKLIAEKIENKRQYRWCKQLGFDYFQGYLLSCPSLISADDTVQTRDNIIEMLHTIITTDNIMPTITSILLAEPVVQFKLFKLLNSELFTKPEEIYTLEQAEQYFGADNLKNMLALVILSMSCIGPCDMLFEAAKRAKMCEMIARTMGDLNCGAHFTLGWCSVLENLLDIRLENLLLQLNIETHMTEALLNNNSVFGSTLQDVIAYELGDTQRLQKHPLSLEYFAEANRFSCEWARRVRIVLCGCEFKAVH